MKTLDEMIEYFNNQCKTRHVYLTEDADERFYDVLNYLKMYRSDKLQWEADRKLWQEKVEEFEEAKQKYIDRLKELEIGTLNVPLSWDELKAMKDKPIWIEFLNGKWKGWDVIAGFYDDDFGVAMVTIHNDDYYKLELGKTWQAYRKERK